MNGFKKGDKIKIRFGNLETKIIDFKTIGNSLMVETDYGDFNITLIEKA